MIWIINDAAASRASPMYFLVDALFAARETRPTDGTLRAVGIKQRYDVFTFAVASGADSALR